ncbi:MAG: hypothetical protein M3Y79_06815 [Pseudomonadota bacterium]|nr:hypothetical protein [Pseudomonadota bacterium]
MPNTRSIYRRNRKRPARTVDGADPVARQYEGGREAPFSPRTPENAQGTPAVEEAERRAEAGNVSKTRDGKDGERSADTRPAGPRKAPRSVH